MEGCVPMKLLIVLLLTLSQAFAIDVTPIKKGQPSPGNGFFIDTKNMKEIRKINEEKKNLKKQTITLKDIGHIDQERIAVHKRYARAAQKQLEWEQTKGTWKTIGGFALGVLITGAIGYAALRSKGK